MKKLLVAATLALILLSGCNLFGPLINPIIGTWEVSLLGITTTYVFNANATSTETTTIGDLGVTKNGTWSSDASTLTIEWDGSSPENNSYSFNSDKSTMTLAPIGGGISITLTRQ